MCNVHVLIGIIKRSSHNVRIPSHILIMHEFQNKYTFRSKHGEEDLNGGEAGYLNDGEIDHRNKDEAECLNEGENGYFGKEEAFLPFLCGT